MRSLKFFALIFLFTLINNVKGQAQAESINEGTINDKFEFVIKKSTNWNDERGQSYEVVRRNMLTALRSHTIDSLNAQQAKLATVNMNVANQQEEIETLKTSLAKIQSDLDATNAEKDSMELLGMQLSKSGYSATMGTIIVGLLALLLFFVFKFKNSNAITSAAKSKLAEIESEFGEYKRVALEREQKVKRQLQDELNKQRN